jgi:hypothetical protein
MINRKPGAGKAGEGRSVNAPLQRNPQLVSHLMGWQAGSGRVVETKDVSVEAHQPRWKV